MSHRIPDIDIDFKDRDAALEELLHIPASRLDKGDLVKHNVGVYFQSIPTDPLTGLASIPYKEAEARNYFKVDFLNLKLYNEVQSVAHMDKLMSMEPVWDLLEDEDFVSTLFHLGNWAELTAAYKPRSVMELAMVLAVIRPGKQHLMGLPFDELEKDIWNVDPDADDDYMFKKAHAVSYAYAVVVQINLKVEALFAEPAIPEHDQTTGS